MAPEIDPKSFGTFEKRAPGLSVSSLSHHTNVYGELKVTSRAASNRDAKVLWFIGFLLGLEKRRCKESGACIRYERTFGQYKA